IFDDGLKKFAPNLNGSKWKYDVAFNGGHFTTEEILKTSYGKAQTTRKFAESDYLGIIKSYKEKIESGAIKKNEQLIIMINTHGGINNDSKKVTHEISLSGKPLTNLDTLKGSETASLDDLTSLRDLAESKGIRLGIIDLSCHSGSTQNLKSTNTCVISATSPKHYAFAGPNTFAENFLSTLKPGVTLEQAFLKARGDAKGGDTSYPMISTEEHAAVEKAIYSNIAPYLFYQEGEKSKKLSNYLSDLAPDNMLICIRESQFQELISKINELQKISPALQTSKIISLLNKYKKEQDKVILDLKLLGGDLLENEEIFVKKADSSEIKPIKVTLKWKDILSKTQIEQNIITYKATINLSKTKKEKLIAEAELNYYQELLAKRNAIIKKYPKLVDFEKTKKGILKKIDNNKDTAIQIANEERLLYDEAYKANQGLNFNDPCRKIVF
ncbi:MAG: hypothetical protein K2Q18_06280, partial [Bdellovibrionales bacterium]|nr:hypothetical protein [Bdellovibrionales bacterium]